jgi:hypothetical protein
MAITLLVEMHFKLADEIDAETAFDRTVEVLESLEQTKLIDVDAALDLENRLIILSAEASGNQFSDVDAKSRTEMTQVMEIAIPTKTHWELVFTRAETWQEKLIGSL